ncbi:MAG: hypothetical protein K2P19_08260 [Kineothrix sp.]|nr:hypothetical protein [Kineothrix sp.]
MAEAKKKTTAAKAVKTEPEATLAVEEPKAVAVEKKEEAKPAVQKAPAKKTATKKAAEKKAPAKKAVEKKAPAGKEETKAKSKKAAVQQSLHIQYSDKNVSMEDLQKIAADVWKYDLGKGDEEYTSLDLYVKPEENTVYYVFNGDVQGSFLI